MLIPAVLKKDEIKSAFHKYYYTDDMMYETGSMGSNWVPEIRDIPDDSDWGLYQFASVGSKDNLIGFLSYRIDWYTSIAYNFGMISFDRGNPLFGKDVFDELNKLIYDYKLHKIEWKMVSGNPVEKAYDSFCNKYNGHKIYLHDVFKDKYGKYHDSIIYEIIDGGKST